MDFIVRLLRTQSGYNALWVIVDRLTKTSHILPIKDTTLQISWGYCVRKIARLHEVSKTIVSNRDIGLMSIFLRSFINH